MKDIPSHPARLLLLVEDNPADADLVEELLEQAGGENYRIIRATRISDAVEKLGRSQVDVVLLDLRLPDGAGVATLRAIRAVDQRVPVVVLTGTDDEELAMSCIYAGAQDYLAKSEIKPITLRRAIGYAITRIREAQLRQMEELLLRYRAMSNHTSQTSVTAALAGSGAIRDRYPSSFAELVQAYSRLLAEYCEQPSVRKDRLRDGMEQLITTLGDAGAGPRDLLDVHIAALDVLAAGSPANPSSSMVIEGRLLALEMMGLLVDFYRVGLRRHKKLGGRS